MTQEEVLQLFDTYHNMVYRLALTMTHSRQDAEDIVQIVFLKLLDGKSFPSAGKERPWLAAVTVNACKDLLRSFWRRNIEPLDEMIPIQMSEERALFDAVMALPTNYRVVVHLHYYEGYTLAEIGEMLQIKPSSVSMRLHRARNLLRSSLQEDAYEQLVSADL
ncbi:MAG: sigma-70 family RNA polymerase sigma factor [Oscillospiraceae bacterium]|nr:sigma-70 family RNA polymerase sigma factor [Oscillospiraceae bacterium]